MDLPLDNDINSSQIENNDKHLLSPAHGEKEGYVNVTEAECTRDHQDKNRQQTLFRALSTATESRNSVTKIKPKPNPPPPPPCSSAEGSFNVYVYGPTVRSSHGSRRSAPKSDEYTSRLVDAECDGIPALSLVGRDSTQDMITSFLILCEMNGSPASQPRSQFLYRPRARAPNFRPKSKQAYEPPKSRRSPRSMETRNPKGITNALLASWVRIRYMMKGKWTDGGKRAQGASGSRMM
ncbi:hypothetical protein EVAR_100871_1 [Eumeta japonica]|uniref:Uncharacterized protein n=1 Tax=Eumeta variegata TaxID=151549 RepID=A0A4C1T0E5_EUMVA|nr:hypothetical protein EVAR_100871_1 [Eumeta japonica]